MPEPPVLIQVISATTLRQCVPPAPPPPNTYAHSHSSCLSALLVCVFHPTRPVFTAIFAVFFLKESFTPFDALATLLSFVGVIFVAQPVFLVGKGTEESSGPGAKSVMGEGGAGGWGVALCVYAACDP